MKLLAEAEHDLGNLGLALDTLKSQTAGIALRTNVSQAEMEANQANAKGDASKIVEDGKATVAVLEEMIATWKLGGENARDIFLMQKLQTLMSSMVGTIDQIEIDTVTVLPRGEGADGTAAKAVRLVEELEGALPSCWSRRPVAAVGRRCWSGWTEGGGSRSPTDGHSRGAPRNERRLWTTARMAMVSPIRR